jgi:hypothetical protein
MPSKTVSLTIRLDRRLQTALERWQKETGKSRSELAREALRRQWAIAQFEDVRQRIVPVARLRGFRREVTDDMNAVVEQLRSPAANPLVARAGRRVLENVDW